MTAPLGYKEGTRDGTLVGDEEKKSFSQRIYNMLAPNEKMSDEQLRLQGINPSSVLPEERPMAKNNPEGILQGLFRELIGAKKAEGSELSDKIKQLENLEFLRTMSLGIPGSTLFTASSPETIERLDKQIRDLRLDIFGEE